MKFLVGADDDVPLVAHVADALRRRGHDVDLLPVRAWGDIARDVAKRVARGDADQGVVCCWTGTGVAMAANKVRGIRAALCTDAATAAGARMWNDANVLALSLRLASTAVASEILDAWLSTSYGGTEEASLTAMHAEERS